jgi:hypothetical protein
MSLFIAASFFFASCEKDDENAIILSPQLSLVSGAHNQGATYEPDEKFIMGFSATKGTKAMKALRIEEGGTNMPTERIQYNGEAAIANPRLLTGGLSDFFSLEIGITANATPGAYEVRFVVIDDDNSETSYTFSYNVEILNDLNLLEGILFNAGGPQGNGGINLETGLSVGSRPENGGHVRDLGIDLGLPPTSNWIQKIAPISGNGVTLRQVTGIDFDAINFSGLLSEIYNGGTEVSNQGTVEKVQVGDMFIAKQDDKYYFFIVREVNVIASGNGDNYVLDIKKR